MTGPQTAQYLFDQTAPGGAGSEGGLGVRTLQSVTDSIGHEVEAKNAFQQPTQDTDAPQADASFTQNFLYDAAGYVTSKSVVGGQTRTLTWDAWGRLVKVVLRDGAGNGSDSTTVYDGLGRRVQSTFQNINTGSPDGDPGVVSYYYDPEVEFLEMGNGEDGYRRWNVRGPDLNGVYGSLQGTGGLEAIVDEVYRDIYGSINDRFGNAVGLNGAGFSYAYGTALGGYGWMPGSLPDGTASQNLWPQWRGKYVDWSGFCYLGARYYDPTSGRFLSPDPLGHGASMSLYDYCAGDPINGLDPDGRFATWWANTRASLSDQRNNELSDGVSPQEAFDGLSASVVGTAAFFGAPALAEGAASAATEVANAAVSWGQSVAASVTGSWAALTGTGSLAYAVGAPAGQNLLTHGVEGLDLGLSWSTGSPVGSSSLGNITTDAVAGQFERVIESTRSARAAIYQSKITGTLPDVGYVLDGVKFDGFDAARGVLLEAKGPGYASFVKNGGFIPNFYVNGQMVDQARRQLSVGGGVSIELALRRGSRGASGQNFVPGARNLWNSNHTFSKIEYDQSIHRGVLVAATRNAF